MKIRLLSDLHQEFRPETFRQHQFIKHQGEDVTILAGDIAVGAKSVAEVLEMFLLAGHRKIIYVPGNHEFYGKYYTETMQDLGTVCHDRDVVLLQPGTVYTKDNVVFFGGTLWTNFCEDATTESLCREMISDFRVIRGFSPAMCKTLYYNDLSWIKRVYQKYSGYKKVIVTHFLPAQECVDVRYAGSALNKYFANDLGEWIKLLDDTTWMYGHTHCEADFKLGNTRMICNPLGYPHEYNYFSDFKTIEV